MSDQPDDTPQDPVSAAYAELDLDVSFFPPMWLTLTIGHFLTTDLDQICRAHGLSAADLNLLGAVRTSAKRLRATDLANMLNVSHAVISPRIAKLESKGFLQSLPSETDRRAMELEMTPAGIAVIGDALMSVEKSSRFVRSFRRLPSQDQADLVRIMSELQRRLLG